MQEYVPLEFRDGDSEAGMEESERLVQRLTIMIMLNIRQDLLSGKILM